MKITKGTLLEKLRAMLGSPTWARAAQFQICHLTLATLVTLGPIRA